MENPQAFPTFTRDECMKGMCVRDIAALIAFQTLIGRDMDDAAPDYAATAQEAFTCADAFIVARMS